MPGVTGSLRRAVARAALDARVVADLGPQAGGAVLANTVRSGLGLRRARRAEREPAVTRSPGRLVEWWPLAAAGTGAVVGARCRFAEAELEVRFVADDLVRLSWGPADPPLPWGRAGPFPDAPAGDVVVRATPSGGCAAAGDVLTVDVDFVGSVRLLDAAGGILRHERPPLRQRATRRVQVAVREGEQLSGLGQRAAAPDLRGGVGSRRTYRLWNRDPSGPGGAPAPEDDPRSSGIPLSCGIPVTVGLHRRGNVLAFYENPYEAVVTVDGSPAAGTARMEIAFGGGMLRHYLAVGPLPRLLERYSELTGRPALPPRWALGYHQGRGRCEADVRRVTDGFAAEGLPLSAVLVDLDRLGGRPFTVDPTAFPDVGALSADLARRGTRLVATVEPALTVDGGDDLYRDGRDGGHFVRAADGSPLAGVLRRGRGAYPDFTDPSTRRWWGGHYQRLTDGGIAGVWHDMNEPTSLALAGDRTLPRDARHHAEGRGGDHREAHNAYGLLMNEAARTGLAAARPGRRPFIVSRAGWAGLQRSAGLWTSVESTWDALAEQVATTLDLGLCGVPFTGSDVGGSGATPSPELFLRWLELCVLMPVCRTHSTSGVAQREPWRFEPPVRDAVGRLIRLRYRLLPYLYAQARQAHLYGHPLVRPTSWPVEPLPGPPGAPAADGPAPGARAADGPAPGAPAADDAFLLGPVLLVAPALREGQTSRTVALPPGDWYRWRLVPALGAADAPASWDDEVTVVGGGRTVTLDTPAGQPVVLARAGAVVPLDDGWADPDARLTEGHEPRLLALHCFPGPGGWAAGAGYDDAGDGDGPSRTDRWLLEGGEGPGGGVAVLRWLRQGRYPPPRRVRVVHHAVADGAATADGRPVRTVVAGSGFPATTVECAPFAALRLRRRGA